MIRYLLLFILCLPVAQAQQDILLDKLLLMSGLDEVVASYPEQLNAHFGDVDASGKDGNARLLARQRLLDAYKEIDAPMVLRGYVASELSSDDVKAIVVWFESPLGQRLTLAEQRAGSAAGVQAMGEYLDQLDKNPPDEERISLVRKFEKVARLTAINLSVIKVMFETELLAINAVALKSERQTSNQLSNVMHQKFYDMREMMMPGLMARLLAVSYYVLSEFINDEVQTYLDFLSSAAGRKLIVLYERAPVAVFAQVVRSAGIDVIDNFLQLP